MNHTPGPWGAILQRGNYAGNYNIGRETDVGKGPLLTFAVILGPNDVAPQEYAVAARANAYLVAAAPDLLAACKKLIEAEMAATDEGNFELLVEATEMAHAAIARVEGERGKVL